MYYTLQLKGNHLDFCSFICSQLTKGQLENHSMDFLVFFLCMVNMNDSLLHINLD